jgi:hypothetical protein
MDISLAYHETVVDGVVVSFDGLPLLHCPKCDVVHLPGHARNVASYFAAEANEKDQTRVALTPTGIANKRYPYCKVNFLYSAMDHDFIPGLKRPWNDGFLTPVMFNLSVLNKYAQDPSYHLDLFSNSYGSIMKGEDINIQFGINRNNKVVMWLGDIDKLPEGEQYYLRSENVESDHDLCSEYYDAQIGAVWAKPSDENMAIHARSNLNAQCRESLGGDLYQLPAEIARVLENLRRPLFWEDHHVAPVAESFNRVMVESIDVEFLKKQLRPHLATKDELKNLKALKLMELWLERCLGCADPKSATLPFFVLYDFRLLACHLRSDDNRVEVLKAINTRLGLPEANTSFEQIYFALLPKLTTALDSIKALVATTKPVAPGS